MSDNKRELLELAAKGAGIEIEWSDAWRSYTRRVLPEPVEPYSEWLPWNPLTDDGDAFRLAVKCGLLNLDDVLFYYGGSIDFQDDPYAATRLAIVRNAAEIGRKMV